MQNDLIGRSELKNILRPYYDKILDQNISDEEMLAKHDMLSDVMHEINDIPTAYNPEKVVQQLEEKLLHEVCPGCGYLKDNICTYKGANCMVSRPAYESIKKVFADVRNGGKE